MEKYKTWYHNRGITHASDFNSGVMNDIGSAKLPMYSMAHLFDLDSELEPDSDGLFNTNENVVLHNEIELATMVNSTKLTVNESTFLKELRAHTNLELLSKALFNRILMKKPKTLKKTLLVRSYKHLNDMYKYKETSLVKHDIYVNSINTLIKLVREDIEVTNSNQFISIEIPSTLLSKTHFEELLGKEINSTILNSLDSNAKLFLHDLFKLFTDEDTPFTGLVEVANKVNFFIRSGSNYKLLNLEILLSYSERFPDILKSQSKSNDSVMFKRLQSTFITLLDANINKSSLEDGDIEELFNESEAVLDEVVVNKEDFTEVSLSIMEESKPNNKYKNIKELDKLGGTIEDSELLLEELLENKTIDNNKSKKLKEIVSKTLKQKSPFKNDNRTIEEMMIIKEDEIVLSKEATKLPRPTVLFNEKDSYDSNLAITKHYFNNIHKKAIIATFMLLNKVGLFVKSISVEEESTLLNREEIYKVELSDRGRSNYIIKVRIPLFSETGEFVTSSNNYILRKQKNSQPIVKIAHNRISLSTAYGKIFIDKAILKKSDRGYKIRTQLVKLNETGGVSNLLLNEHNYIEEDVHQSYTYLSRYVKSFVYKKIKFSFSYLNRAELIGSLDNEKAGYILIGKDKDNKYYLNKDNNLYTFNKEFKLVDNFFTFLKIDEKKLTNEFSTIKLYKHNVPVILLLAYYLSLDKLLESLDIKIERYEGRRNIETLTGIAVYFKSETILFYPNSDADRLLIHGLTNNKDLMKTLDYEMFNSKESFLTIWKSLGLPLNVITDIKLMESFYVDVITSTLPKKLMIPNNFISLLLRANELLMDDNFNDQYSLKHGLIKGYDRIPQFLHMLLSRSLKEKLNAEQFGRSKLVVDEYGLLKMLGEDSSVALIDDLNPMASLKQKAEFTLTGIGGRNKDTLTGKTRGVHVDDIGIVSESSKDSGDVGVSAYLSANPNINSVLGDIEIKDDNEWSNLLSDPALISPFTRHDDGKRVLYSSIQQSHVVPMKNPRPYPVRTGYETLIPYKAGKKSIGVAEFSGKVISVTNNVITIDYKKEGKVKYTFKDWTSKEESGSTFIHEVVSNVKVDDSVNYGDIIYYDKAFFVRDMFNPKNVLYVQGTPAKIGFTEDAGSYEDGCSMSAAYSKKSTMDLVKVKTITLDSGSSITGVKEVNDKLTYDEPIMFLDADIIGDGSLTKETKELLAGFARQTPKANVSGKIIKIQLFYNCEYEELSKSLKSLADSTAKYVVDVDGKTIAGKVDGRFSYNGKKLDNNSVLIKYFIKSDYGMSNGDKGVVANQLKTTVSDVYPGIQANGNDVDMIFSLNGVYSRIVLSADLAGTTAMVLEGITKNALDIYFNE